MTFVLLHGAWHGAWCWDDLTRHLEDAGHRTVAPTLPGHSAKDDHHPTDIEEYVAAVMECIGAQDEPVVLVGHSSAGILMQLAVPRMVEKVRALVFVNSFLVGDGECQMDVVPAEAAQALLGAAGDTGLVPVIEPFVRGVLMPGDLPALQDRVLAQLVPQPVCLFTARIDTKPFREVDVPRAAILADSDMSLPPGGYQELARKHCGESYKEYSIPGGHEVMLSDPAGLAHRILDFVESVDAHGAP